MILKNVGKNICTLCKGSRHLCGRPVCPILLRIRSLREVSQKIGRKTEFFGSSPPGVFVGEWGYPRINIGGLVPPETGEPARLFDSPKDWIKKRTSLLDIIKFRASLLYSKANMHIKTPSRFQEKLLEKLQELSMSIKPTDVEVKLRKPPLYRLTFDGIVTPIGVEGQVNKLDLASNPVIPRKVDQIIEDKDIKTVDAIWELYSSNISIYSLIRMLSVGVFGYRNRRKLVPTRWSITAVDKMLSEKMRKTIITYDLVSDILVFHNEYLGNHYEIIMYPHSLALEMIEIWMPQTIWVPTEKPEIYYVYELADGRVSDEDGGYYAIRLGVFEYLNRIRRQAAVIVVREIRPEYFAPVGNWQIRENVRTALKRPPKKFPSLSEAIEDVQSRLRTPINLWIKSSYLIDMLKYQTTLTDYIKRNN